MSFFSQLFHAKFVTAPGCLDGKFCIKARAMHMARAFSILCLVNY